MWVRLQCPSRNCGVERSYNSRGWCSCGAMLIHAAKPRRLRIEGAAYLWLPNPSGPYTATHDDGTVEWGTWQRLSPGVYERPDRRVRHWHRGDSALESPRWQRV